jgi:hypothetical protein
MTILLLNYGHPLPETQAARLTSMLGEEITIRMIASQVDRERPIAEIAQALADASDLTGEQWQTQPIVVNPPSLAPLAVALIAEIHGRCGGFPAMLNIRPVANSLPTRYEIAEVVNLQTLREAARTKR